MEADYNTMVQERIQNAVALAKGLPALQRQTKRAQFEFVAYSLFAAAYPFVYALVQHTPDAVKSLGPIAEAAYQILTIAPGAASALAGLGRLVQHTGLRDRLAESRRETHLFSSDPAVQRALAKNAA